MRLLKQPDHTKPDQPDQTKIQYPGPTHKNSDSVGGGGPDTDLTSPGKAARVENYQPQVI